MLPSSRILSQLLGVNRSTVKLAYEELISQGWAESLDRKGVFVISNLPVMAKIKLPETVKSNPQNGFIWNRKMEKEIITSAPSISKDAIVIDDGFPDVRLAPIDQLMREYRSLSNKFYGKEFLKYGSSM